MVFNFFFFYYVCTGRGALFLGENVNLLGKVLGHVYVSTLPLLHVNRKKYILLFSQMGILLYGLL